MQNVVDTTMTALMRVKLVSIAQVVNEDLNAKVLEPERTLVRTAENTLNLLSS